MKLYIDPPIIPMVTVATWSWLETCFEACSLEFGKLLFQKCFLEGVEMVGTILYRRSIEHAIGAYITCKVYPCSGNFMNPPKKRILINKHMTTTRGPLEV